MEIQDVLTYFAKEVAKHIPLQEKQEEEEVMTIKDLEEFLQVSRSKAYELIKSDKFPKYKVGSEFRILKSELLVWIREQKEVN